jgi:hypothetical protein
MQVAELARRGSVTNFRAWRAFVAIPTCAAYICDHLHLRGVRL